MTFHVKQLPNGAAVICGAEVLWIVVASPIDSPKWAMRKASMLAQTFERIFLEGVQRPQPADLRARRLTRWTKCRPG